MIPLPGGLSETAALHFQFLCQGLSPFVHWLPNSIVVQSDVHARPTAIVVLPLAMGALVRMPTHVLPDVVPNASDVYVFLANGTVGHPDPQGGQIVARP